MLTATRYSVSSIAGAVFVCSVQALFGQPKVGICLCNLGDVHEGTVSRAVAEVQFIFRSAGVRVLRADCDSTRSVPTSGVLYFVRVRAGQIPKSAGPASRNSMGRAFTAGDDSGSVADVYMPKVYGAAARHAVDVGALLGVVITHELGHLLLGPGHYSGGVMRHIWGRKEMDALRHGRLRFSRADAAQIRELLARPACPRD